jgi:tRNA-specific adenosine deaminase 2
MCAYALELVKISQVYFGCYNPRFGGNGTILSVNSYPSEGGFLEEKCLKILQEFYEEGN